MSPVGHACHLGRRGPSCWRPPLRWEPQPWEKAREEGQSCPEVGPPQGRMDPVLRPRVPAGTDPDEALAVMGTARSPAPALLGDPQPRPAGSLVLPVPRDGLTSCDGLGRPAKSESPKASWCFRSVGLGGRHLAHEGGCG